MITEKHSEEFADDDDLMNAKGISNKGTSRAVGLNYGSYEEGDVTEKGNQYGLGSDADLRSYGERRSDARNNNLERYREQKRIL